MSSELVQTILQRMSDFLDEIQMNTLQSVLNSCLQQHIEDQKRKMIPDEELISTFISAKRVEGCSEKTLRYYSSTLKNVFSIVSVPVRQITTNDIRVYLAEYQGRGTVSKVTIDNIRRILSSFYSWLEDEDFILKSPIRRIKKVKVSKVVKEVYSDETLEIIRDSCENLRDLAMVDLLSSTGMRVGELVMLDRADIDFQNRECVVLGKGDKERLVYFDARTKVHLRNYIDSRTDDNPALFVTLNKPSNRLEISGVEKRLRELGRRLNIDKVHPHKFRRTLATKAIDKGMPIEQVQKLLGHQKIDTTLEYAMVSQNNVKISHRKYIG